MPVHRHGFSSSSGLSLSYPCLTVLMPSLGYWTGAHPCTAQHATPRAVSIHDGETFSRSSALWNHRTFQVCQEFVQGAVVPPSTVAAAAGAHACGSAAATTPAALEPGTARDHTHWHPPRLPYSPTVLGYLNTIHIKLLYFRVVVVEGRAQGPGTMIKSACRVDRSARHRDFVSTHRRV